MLYRKCVRRMCIHTQPEGGAGRVAGDVIVVLGADRPVSGQAGSSLVEDVGHACTGQTLFYKMFYEIPQIYMIPQDTANCQKLIPQILCIRCIRR